MSLSLQGLAFAFTAGVFSIFSPCGYALLPGYMSFYLGSRSSVPRAVSGGIACTLGLMTVFSIIGGLASSLGAMLHSLIPVLDLLTAAILIVMGVGTIMEMRLPYVSIPVKPSQRRGLIGLYLFGIVYGFAGAGCSAPIFLSVLSFAISRGFPGGVIIFIAYVVGMGVPLVVTNVLLAEAKEYVITKISSATPWFSKASGVVLIAVGLYLFYFYYITNLS